MRISRRRKKEEPKKKFFYNEGIQAPEVLVLNTDNSNLGIMNTGEAIRRARADGLDLVEINPKANPPVAKIVNFSQFQYSLEKTERLRKAHQHVTKVKCLRVSLNIGAHDLEIKRGHASRFLDEGDKVKIEVILRGREIQQSQMAVAMIQKFNAELNAEHPTRFDQAIEVAGKVVSAIIAKA